MAIITVASVASIALAYVSGSNKSVTTPQAVVAAQIITQQQPPAVGEFKSPPPVTITTNIYKFTDASTTCYVIGNGISCVK